MACSSCASGGCLTGCSKKGGCSSGGCNRLNTFNWLSDVAAPSYGATPESEIVEISFKQGARKAFYRKPTNLRVSTGDFVAVETSGGYDIGHVSLSGELVRLQLKRKRVRENAQLPNVLRIANERDMERMIEARSAEKETMVKARAIARSLHLDMKIGDIEIQGDKRKATFFYTAEGRVDFRELIRQYAREFKVRIEMRQIGARQESARVGGLGPCGRELCCSTWLSDFKTVGTGAARYQNLAINQSKLSGQCGRLKCCLNYELEAYLDAFRRFPKHADKIQTENGPAELVKTDIFKRLMYYAYREQPFSKLFALPVEKVFEILALNAKGEKAKITIEETSGRGRRGGSSGEEVGFADVTGEIELKPLPKKNKKKKKKKAGEGEGTENRGPRPEGQERRSPRPEGQESRGPRPEGQERRGPRPEGQPNRGPKPPQENRAPRPEGQEPRAPRPEGQERGPRPEGSQEPRGPRPEGQERRGPRPEGQEPRGPRPEGTQEPRGPRPEGQERQERRGPRPEGQEPRGPRPEGAQEPRGPRPEHPDGGEAAKNKKKKKKRPGGGNRPPGEQGPTPPTE
jgi:cell fate regulator YaaT (PSP1 superfamily)